MRRVDRRLAPASPQVIVVTRMGQLSFFSADVVPPVIDDLGGVLAAAGQIATGPDGSRLSILVADATRATALVAECASRRVVAGVEAEREPDGGNRRLVRTQRCAELTSLARAWTRGATKGVPEGLSISAGFLRLWVLAAGRIDDTGYLLGVDPHSPDNVEPLIAACARAGLAGSYIGHRGGGPAIRIVGHKRLARLVDTVGTLPDDLPLEVYPVEPQLHPTAVS